MTVKSCLKIIITLKIKTMRYTALAMIIAKVYGQKKYYEVSKKGGKKI
jgi:hypothetical protein